MLVQLKRIRTSRSLEEALQVRLDFRWLAEARSIDHTTISNIGECPEQGIEFYSPAGPENPAYREGEKGGLFVMP